MKFKDTTIKIAKEAGKIILKESKNIQFESKNDFDVLAKADLLSEKYILGEINKNFPNTAILSEEAGENEVDSRYKWIVDPLDGTINFTQGLDDFCISIALAKDEEVILGVIYEPKRDNLYYAEKGNGAYLNDKKIKVKNDVRIKDMVGVTESVAHIKFRKENLNMLLKIANKVKSIRISGCAALNLARLAAGKLDFYFNANLNLWDIAAGILLIQEAGGKYTDLRGDKISLNSKNSLATSEKAYDGLKILLMN